VQVALHNPIGRRSGTVNEVLKAILSFHATKLTFSAQAVNTKKTFLKKTTEYSDTFECHSSSWSVSWNDANGV